jgi:hypothetical protein
MKRLFRCLVYVPILLLALPALVSRAQTPHRVSLATMSPRTRALFLKSMDGNAQLWDPSVHLIRSPEYVPGHPAPDTHLTDTHYWEKCCSRVRETSFYALGLLIRDAPGDRQTAAEALNEVLRQQYTQPGVRWFGTYKRTPEETVPATGAVMWRDYDPNWREFIGVTLEMILVEFSDRLPAELAQRLYHSIDLAVQGEMDEKRLMPAYTNPALMYGALWDFAAVHGHRADWQKQSADWIDSVYALFAKYGAYAEYNSPTYYGVDLQGTSLWRDYGSTEHIRNLGSRMEAQMWHDVAALYQPELHNLCGPYDRSYSMDMEPHADLVALWMANVLDVAHSPLPPIEQLNGASLSYMPQVAVLGARIPAEDLAHMATFQGEHAFRRQITDDRIATAWVGKQAIWGAEFTSKTRGVGKDSQFHPVTVQWRLPSGGIGWIDLVSSPPIDATAARDGITISATGTLRLRIHASGLTPDKLTAALWDLPGLRVSVTSDAKGAFAVQTADAAFNVYREARAETYDVIYPDGAAMTLKIANQE